MQDRIIKILKVGIILALNVCIIALAVYSSSHSVNEPASVQALSKVGSRGDEVTKIQTNLKKWGYYAGNIDGIFGSQTEQAVRAFQKKNGLTVDGIAGPKTLEAMGISTGSTSGGSAAASSKDVALLARIISAESRGEPYTGQVAVGACVLNRVKHPSFPNTLAGVVYQPGAFTAITDGQIDQPVADSAKRAAQDALNGWDPSGGAIYYYNPDKTSNKWIRTRPVIKRIGNHLFCS
ncbi:N-acetylmuramoyl-L-alanine amidase [Acetanaerobacterium elongatum]|uniref:Spore cortex-lytic enzyme n=1 Tax=Acetanaerobacterium elongatum TaxID=258515 RepID=A0A1H0G4I5_9FIRM|nr:N-acetylmuramoyl-L-alanine amidase [Acetanaerobacterium elongatum]